MIDCGLGVWGSCLFVCLGGRREGGGWFSFCVCVCVCLCLYVCTVLYCTHFIMIIQAIMKFTLTFILS